MSVRFSRARRSPGKKFPLDIPKLQLHGDLSAEDDITTAAAALSFESECFEQLVKENLTLKKHLSDRNTIIELAGVELRNMKTSLQKLQLQNLNLAQANIHIAAELNSSRGQLKALHHELVCKDALLRSKGPELQEYTAEAAKESLHDSIMNKKRAVGRSRSAGTAIFQESAEKEGFQGKKRHCVRRKTVFEHKGIKGIEKDESGTAMVRRPPRGAAQKVQSYKERSINVKMRMQE